MYYLTKYCHLCAVRAVLLMDQGPLHVEFVLSSSWTSVGESVFPLDQGLLREVFVWPRSWTLVWDFVFVPQYLAPTPEAMDLFNDT